ncbi:methylmalonyl Co-A mutase-associated GTPase MeaB [Sandaracinus amylolyticus]|uniref:methylmalonyl Co-A mutase-associated GTPase MeaB n=1 Tax=Sandaracinus amylolyticus TaxID=927083 RepID=UPI001F0012C8|nr:methylmalonyl Co-A mutase-associated GTPase MeaB [Sandaracinus amylolyticus]UJR80579.1 Methylmalonyl Co-A mutase-associated GTPase MeaB [Sandaracinus amylolyticus]
MVHELSIDELVDGVRSSDRAVLGRALTLVESNAARHRARAEALLTRLLPFSGRAKRVGLTGVPGAGKSTFLEALGTRLTGEGKRVAVLAVDPTSSKSGGSILGDKTRMAKLSRDERAFVRPSPSGGALGGVARKTREALLVCEAAGFDVVIVETVGVGQSETAVASMVDTFVLLWLPSSGDELQGIKRGIVELADVVVVNKADGERIPAAERASSELSGALRYLAPATPGWATPVLTASALEGTNVDAVWRAIEGHRATLERDGELERRRSAQEIAAMWSAVESELRHRLHLDPAVRALASQLEREVASRAIPPAVAASRIVDAF